MKRFFSILLTAALFLSYLPSRVFALEFTSPPGQVIIPSIDISLPVYTAKVAYNTWEVRTDGASFGEGTTLPGNEGNTVIFSHARPELFGQLPEIKKNEFIHVFTDNDWFVYRVIEIMVVDPERIDVIFSKKNHELTLYTCTGSNYEKRYIVKAELIPQHK